MTFQTAIKFGTITFTTVILLITSYSLARAALYTTWPGVEPDKCATAWLIQRFADKQAVFSTVPKGEIITGAIPFDTPQGALKVTRQNTTFSAVLKKFNLKDQALMQIAIIIRDIEMNQWEKTPAPEAAGIKALIYGLAVSEGENMATIKKSFPIFDYLYAYYRNLEK